MEKLLCDLIDELKKIDDKLGFIVEFGNYLDVVKLQPETEKLFERRRELIEKLYKATTKQETEESD